MSPTPVVGASDNWIPLSRESSAWDENTDDLVRDADWSEGDEEPRLALVGCELALPDPDSWSWLGGPVPRIVENGHTEKTGHWLDYDQIPRRPDRPDSYLAYRYPLAGAPVVSGYDLDKPDSEQRRGEMNATGHGGVDLVDALGAPIKMLHLEHQVGDAEVLYVGTMYGQTVVTRHVVREGGVLRDYVLLFGHLDRAGDDVRRGRRLRDGDIVGFVGNSASPRLVHLHLEARRVRDGVDPWRLYGEGLRERENSIVTDPRNVLPLRSPALHSPRCAPKIWTPPRAYWLGSAMELTLW
jgi:murein DD-endopeptidase MepM/ murein hydrolase activator NlpD